MLTWSCEGEQAWIWPTFPNGRLYADFELPQAFRNLYLEFPQCAMQEMDPTKKHPYNIWVVQKGGAFFGEIAAACALKGQGCGSWICLTDLLEKYPDIPSQIYEERPPNDLGTGIPSFYIHGILGAWPTHRTNDHNVPPMPAQGQSSLSHVLPTPPPPYSNKTRGCGFGGGDKVITSEKDTPKISPQVKRNLHLHTHGNGDPFAIDGRQLFTSDGISWSSSTSQFTIPPFPLGSTISSESANHTKPTMAGPSVPESLELPPSNQLAQG
ncbi:hypothetical protein K439DRAFT_1621357 [Ramaria rubella]|nr:hypothetical protein K439DRAFT_1621357 [Ramaria rubella]